MRIRHLSALAVVAAALAVLPAAPALAVSPAAAVGPAVTDPAAIPGGDFYRPPATLPTDNGGIIRYQDSTVAYLGVPAKRIMYKSTDVHGDPVAVTGTLLLPTAPWKGPGDRPLVSFAVGTIGQGDQCAPSILFNQGLEYEAATIFPMLAAGAAVVVTDYQGLGTPDRVHTYVNRVDEANAVLDAARAAQNLAAAKVPGVNITSDGPVGIYGYSQGGGASAAAAELQPSYAPELQLVGAAAGAPPADLGKVAAQIDGTVLAGAFGYTVNGLIQDYRSQVEAPLLTGIDGNPPLLNQRGKEVLAATARECVAETALRFAFQHTSDYTTSGQPATSFLGIEPFKSIVAAQQIGTLKPTAPVYIWQGRNDDLIPFGQSVQLAEDWCEQGATVQFQEYDLPPVLPGFAIGHALPAVVGLPAAQSWLYQRFAGAQPPTSCGNLPKA